MSNDIVTRSPHWDAICAVTKVEDVASGVSFPTSKSQASHLADTFIIAHYDGEGASTLALMLSSFITRDPMIFEIGTPASRAFKSLPEERRFAPPVHAANPVNAAIDERLRHPEIPAIVEFGRMHWRDAINVARHLQGPRFSATVYFCFLASENDQTLQIPNLASDAGLHKVLVFGGHKIARETRDGVIKIPTIPSDMQRLVYSEGLSLTDAANTTSDKFSLGVFLDEMKQFGLDVNWELTG